MERRKVLVLILSIVFFGGFCCASAASPARFASLLFSNLLSALLRRLWSVTTDSRIAISSRPNVKFESGYSVETVFDGSRHGIEPFSVEVMPGGELLVLDSENSNIYKISLPLSKLSNHAILPNNFHSMPMRPLFDYSIARKICLEEVSKIVLSKWIYLKSCMNTKHLSKSYNVNCLQDLWYLDSSSSIRWTLNIRIHTRVRFLYPSTSNIDSRPKLVAGSAYGLSGHVDGKPREARMNHPKGLTVDDKGNIYVADTKNKAIRKISDSGVTTIAIGKSYGVGRIGLHIEDAKFSEDFEVVYVSSSCSLLVVDRGNQAIREIQLNFDDCADQSGARLSLGIAMLFAAAFFGYMLASVQRRWVAVASSSNEDKTTTTSYSASPQSPFESSLRPLIRPETETRRQEEEEESFFTSLKEFTVSAASSIAPIFGRILSRNQQQRQEANVWPLQESLAVPDEEPPPLETQTHSPRKTYAFMSKNSEKLQQLRHDTAYFDGWGGAPQPQHRPR